MERERAPNPGAPTAGQGSGYSLFGYDALGQTTYRDRCGKDGQRHTFNFNWDADGRLREVWENGAPALTAQYTADGERVNKTDGAGAHVNSFRLHDSAGTGTTYTPGFAERKNGQDRYSSQDHLGSTRYLTDSTGNTTPAALRYDAYGLRSASAGTDSAHPTDYQYAGAWGYQREETAGLGLDYLHHRYYDADSGRFVTRHPIKWAGGLNLYGYVNNNPVQGVDPTGLDTYAVWGSDSDLVMFSGPMYEYYLKKERDSGLLVSMTKPDKEFLIFSLIQANAGDTFIFWGHGGAFFDGPLHSRLGGYLNTGRSESLDLYDVHRIAAERTRLGKGKLGK